MNSKVFLIKHVPSGILFADDGLTFVFTSKEAAIAEVQFLGDNLDDVEFIETDDLPDSALLWHSRDCYMIINGNNQWENKS